MFKFPKNILPFLFLLAFALVFTACDEDAFVEETLINVEIEEEMPELLEAALPPPNQTEEQSSYHCFQFVFPVEIILSNGTTVTAENRPALRALLARIRNSSLRGNFVYPFEVTLANERVVTVENFREFRRLVRACGDREERCFDYNFPIELNIGRRTVTINSYVEWHRAIVAAGRSVAVTINYPISVTLADSTELTIENVAQLARLRYNCGHEDDRGDHDLNPCFTYVYPVNILVDSVSVSVNSRREWNRVVHQARRGATIALGYPVTVTITESGQTITLAGREDWADVREACN